MATACSLETNTSLHPTSNNLLIASSLDTTPSSLVASRSSLALETYDEEREMLKAMMKMVEAMTKKHLSI
jgi:hypothetical protein